MKLVNFYLSFILFLSCTSNIFAAGNTLDSGGEDGNSSLVFSLDGCVSFTNGTNQDYSEFTAVAANDNCAAMSVVGDHLYRVNPTSNPHSCTPGPDGSSAMCVEGDNSCDYNAGSNKAIRFDISIMPSADGTTSLSGLSFYEQAPENYAWIGGDSGPNDYPTLYGVRILKNGSEIYNESENATTTGWTLEEFDFSGAEFIVSEETVFSFELLAYCPIGSGAPFYIWDVDEIKINTTCFGTVNGGNISTDLGIEFDICAGDGISDEFTVELTGNDGENNAWVITDSDANIIAIQDSPTFDFDGAGAGTCLIWNLSWNGELTGAEVGANAADLVGCFGLSNPITVERIQPDGGTISNAAGEDSFDLCINEDPTFDVTLSGNVGGSSAWVITDTDGVILELPAGPPFDFGNAGVGVCLVWHLSFETGLSGAEVGSNANDLQGCFDLSNPITVNRIDCTEPCEVAGGQIMTGSGTTDLIICVGDGNADLIDVTLMDNQGDNGAWVITDGDANILELPSGPPFDLEGAGEGTCLIWYLSYDNVTGADVGSNAADLQGCFALSNAITVERVSEGGPCDVPCEVSGGEIYTGSGTTDLVFCVTDGISDLINVTLEGNEGSNNTFVVTDADANILEITDNNSFDFEGLPDGVCLIWNLSYNDISGAEVGANAGDLSGCFALSNAITVTRVSQGPECETTDPCEEAMVEGGTISISGSGADALEICVGDGESDAFSVESVGANGTNKAWVITDADANILDITDSATFDFEEAGVGVCLVWCLSFEDGLTGAEVGANAADLDGCFALSNPITVTRVDCTDPCEAAMVEGGTISITGSGADALEICVGDGESDAFSVESVGANGTNKAWVITDADANILDITDSATFDFEEAGVGVCLVWCLSFEDGLVGAEVGANASDLSGCFALSNPITVTRVDCTDPCEAAMVEGGTISISGSGADALEICVGDGESDAFSVNSEGANGTNKAWVVTDADANILEISDSSTFDFEGAGVGVCLVWCLSFEDGLVGAEVGANASDLSGCFALSNPITVTRVTCDPCADLAYAGGQLATAGGLTELDICAADGESDLFDVVLTGAEGENAWVITDADGNIIDLPAGPPFDFEGAGEGVCLVWNLSYAGELTGAEVGANASDLSGCFELSNPITVNRFVNGPLCDDNYCADTEIMCLYGIVGDYLAVIDEATGEARLIAGLSGTYSNLSGLSYHPELDELIAVSNSQLDPQLVTIDRYTGEVNPIGLINQPFPNLIDYRVIDAMSYNRADGLIYAAGSSSSAPTSSSQLMTVSQTTGFASEIADISGTCENEADEFAFGTGVAYMLDQCGDEVSLYTLDLTTGAATLVGTSTFGAGMQLAVNPNSGALYSIEDGGRALYSISTDDASFAIVGETHGPEDFYGENISQIAFAPKVVGAVDGGFLVGGPFEVCVGDNMPDFLPQGSVDTYGGIGATCTYICVGFDGKILAINHDPFAMNFDEISAGTCDFMQICYEDINGLEILEFVQDLTGCFDMSNPIDVVRVEVESGEVGIVGGGTDLELCVADGGADLVEFTYSGGVGNSLQWIITDEDLNIVGLPEVPMVDFEGTDAGVCLVWALEYTGDFLAEMGDNALEVVLASGCSALSGNALKIDRVTEGGVCDNLTQTGVLAFSITPNPASDYIDINIERTPSLENNTVQIFDSAGQLISTVVMNGTISTRIDVSSMHDGYYFARIISKDKISTEKFMLNK